MKILTKLAMTALVMSTLSFAAAYLYEKENSYQMKRQYEYVSTLNLLADYRGFAGISERLASEDVLSAKCTADIRASIEFDELRKCLNSDQCKEMIYKDVAENSPELMSSGATTFSYKKSGEVCGNK